MTPAIVSLNHGSPCPCGIGTVTGVIDGRVYATGCNLLSGPATMTNAAQWTHHHTFAEVEQLLRAKVHAAVDRKHYPDDCPKCGAPAWCGAGPAGLDCSQRCP